MSSSSDSDYDVEQYVKPTRVRRTVNDDTADLLGNFDDEKRKQICDGTYEEKHSEGEPSMSEDEDNETIDENAVNNKSTSDNEVDSATDPSSKQNGGLSKEQLQSLLRGASKVNRHVLYVTNLNFDTTKEDLEAYFSTAGTVKSVRIPKKRRGGFAFVEMLDIEGFQRGFQLHNSELHGRNIKVQISEGGKKKSANKKNIIKQKNRKLAEMRNEQKTFTKSGKFYDKDLKKEKAKELLARKRWRKKPMNGSAKT
ncbi:polyadenylate-binding protein 2-like [Teleopsis dalmanni]|uniref:polyadenylate-binding protein 2-like n=1 Tax=Teleopsis dalmanni TaxID=139649 RepID=UPI0018CCCFBD|nr:polyadenylate-binding protein 2-like [Teleopsis dalmanni]